MTEFQIRFVEGSTQEQRELLPLTLGLPYRNVEGDPLSMILTVESEDERDTFREYFYQAGQIDPRASLFVDPSSLYPEGEEPPVEIMLGTVDITAPPIILEEVYNHLKTSGRLRAHKIEGTEGSFTFRIVGEFELDTLGLLLAYRTGNPNSVKIRRGV
jgi:hypothetical protein